MLTELIFSSLLGAVLGSFINVAALRLGGGPPLTGRRSACPDCGAVLAWYELIPVVGYLALRGRCRHCGAAISPRYILVELLAAVAGALTLGTAGFTLSGFTHLLFLLALLTVALVDAREGLVPDAVTLPTTLLGLAAAAFLPWPGLAGAALGAAGAAGALFLVAWLYRKLRGRAGLGMGDVKLAGMIGTFLGAQGAAHAVFLGAVAALVYYGALTAMGRHAWQRPLPFAPFMAAGAAGVLWLYSAPTAWAAVGF
jgi:leader peptidase (prepilin peptidase)/N-methyltransferase